MDPFPALQKAEEPYRGSGDLLEPLFTLRLLKSQLRRGTELLQAAPGRGWLGRAGSHTELQAQEPALPSWHPGLQQCHRKTGITGKCTSGWISAPAWGCTALCVCGRGTATCWGAKTTARAGETEREQREIHQQAGRANALTPGQGGKEPAPPGTHCWANPGGFTLVCKSEKTCTEILLLDCPVESALPGTGSLQKETQG